jgi:NitT/TauT family transport system ATP-binding protein
MLRVESVHKSFLREGGSIPALLDVTLDLEAGQFGTLIGPSGCGKTTLLRIIAGLIPPSGGTVYVDGQPSMTPSAEKAFVFQHFNLFPWRTVLANAAYGLELQGVPRDQRYARAVAALDTMGLAGFEHHYPSEISGGMRQRVGIARALLLRPKILLMDEPFGALDAMTRELMGDDLLALVRREHLTVLFVTHSVDEAVYLSDRIFAMSRRPGRIIRAFDNDARPARGAPGRANLSTARLRDEIWSMIRAEAQAVP